MRKFVKDAALQNKEIKEAELKKMKQEEKNHDKRRNTSSRKA